MDLRMKKVGFAGIEIGSQGEAVTLPPLMDPLGPVFYNLMIVIDICEQQDHRKQDHRRVFRKIET